MSGRLGLGGALFFGLLVATLVVSVFVVRSRTPDLVLEVTAGLPTEIRGAGADGDSARIRFFVRESEPAARVAIVDADEDVVRTLDASLPLEAGRQVTVAWDARDEGGRLVPAGRYRLLVELPGSDREMIWPRRITVGDPPLLPLSGLE